MEKRIFTLTSGIRLPGLFIFVIVFWVAGLLGVYAQTYVARDQADNYNFVWTNGSNQGYGFGPWVITTGGGGFAGAFIDNPGAGGISGLPDPSFGLFANPASENPFVNADRNLIYPLPVGATLSFAWGVNWDSDGSGNKGFNLYVGGVSESNQVININQGGSAAITINGSPMFSEYGTQAMTMHFERVSATQLRVHATGRDGVETYDNTFTLASSAIDALRFYASGLAGGEQRQPYFNNFRISFPSGYTLTEDVTAAAVEITSGSSLGLGTHQLSIGGAGLTGFLQNNGTLLPGTGTVRFAGAASVSGNPVVFHNLVLDSGVGVNFGAGLSTVQQTFEIRSGFVAENAPVLPEGSTLLYAADGEYNRAVEWNNPWHVRVGFNTQLNLNLNAWGNNITIAGNLTIDEGSGLSVEEGPDPWDLILEGDLNLNGQLTLSGSFGRDMQIRGSWNQSFTGSFDPNNREVVFNGTGVQPIVGNPDFAFLRMANPGGEVVLNEALTVNNRLEIDSLATLNMQHHVVSGGGDFNLREGGILKIGHPEGISTLPNTGNVQMSGVRTFSAHATYHYTGQSNQVSGNALPLNSAKTLIVQLAEDDFEFSITTSQMIEISQPGSLQIISGTLLETQSTASQAIEGNGNLVMSGGRYLITSIGATVDKPRLNGNYSITGGVIELGASGNQKLNSGKSYHNLVFSGSGTVTASSTPNISGTVTIKDNKILDLGSSTFGNSTTRLTMTGGRLITSATGTTPDMGGEYNLTGGVIEFANNNTTIQTIRGPESRQYFNIEVTGTRVGNSTGNISIRDGGAFRILDGARFQIASNRAIVGDGDFVLEAGGTLAFAHEKGITLADCGTGDSCGNVRTATRSFSSDAIYELFGTRNPQNTGSGLPPMVRELIINKDVPTHRVNLSQDVLVTNLLRLNRGRLWVDENNLVLGDGNFESLVAGVGNEDFTHSFIVGPLTRGLTQTGENYVFPVGRDDGPQTLVINFNEDGLEFSGTPRLTARFSTELPDSFYGNLPQTFDNVFVDNLSEEGYWLLEPQNISTAEYSVSLTALNIFGILDPAGIRIVKRQNSADDWILAGDSFSFEGVPGNYVFTQQNVAGFSEFALGGSSQNNPLPVDWLSFSATRQADEVLLQWQTASEINNHYFTVLRSQNGLDFASLAQLPGAGNSNRILSYAFADSQPLPGVSYYKIRQTDFDGKTDYSKILAVALPTTLEPALWYQGQTVYIHLPAHSSLFPWSYRFVDLQGRTLHQGQVAGQEGLITLEIPAGNHRIVLFSITQGEQHHTLKIPVFDSLH